MNLKTYIKLKEDIIYRGYLNEIEWAKNIRPPVRKIEFFWEYVYVVLNSGMKQQVARRIYDRFRDNADEFGELNFTLIGHPKKREVIRSLAARIDEVWDEWQKTEDKFGFISKLPYMGKVIRYHLAKNFGLEVIKPDRHLVRISGMYNMSPQELCDHISKLTGDKITVVDSVLWRAANLGLI